MFETSDGVKLHYVDEGDGPVVVLVAGYAAPLTSWRFQHRALIAAGYRVVAVDRRQAGESEFAAHGQRIARHATDLWELLGSFRISEATIVGSSMGVSVALSMVDLFGTGRLRGLVLVDQTPKMINDGDWQLGFYGLTWAGLDEWVRTFPDGVAPFHAPMPDEVMALLAAIAAPYPHDGARALLRDHAVQDWRDVLARIDVPVLAVGGRHSPVWPVESSAFIAEAVPDGRLVIMEDSGHAPMLSEPYAFNERLLEFLGGLA